MAITLYKKQKQVYDFICQYIQRNDFAPTLKEIAEAVGVSSVATVHEHIIALEQKNLIRRSRGKSRALELVNRTYIRLTDSIDLPITGYLTSGAPIAPYIDQNATFKVSPEIVSGKKRAFVLEVRGESLLNDQIKDGDMVIVEEIEEVGEGEVVVAILDGGLSTLKRYFKEESRVRLEAINGEGLPIYALNITIQGKVVGLVRKFG
ncbi:transcriptional repressor LexA [Microgenomates group bacterium]|nr:transcriptional repressor LexA [Microgenomates group bacterium]